MADLWIEKELARQLVPVPAPDGLWDRIQQPRRGARPERSARHWLPPEWVFWPVAVAMVLLAFAGVLSTLRVDRDPDTLPERELAAARASRGFEFRSDSFDDTRAWVKTQSNIDIDLPPRSGPADRAAVRLLGARLIRVRGLPVAAIDYVAGDGAATLLVSGKQAGLSGNTEASKHLFTRIESSGDTRLFSWNMRNQTYAVAFSGTKSSRAACLLCHSNSPS